MKMLIRETIYSLSLIPFKSHKTTYTLLHITHLSQSHRTTFIPKNTLTTAAHSSYLGDIGHIFVIWWPAAITHSRRFYIHSHARICVWRWVIVIMGDAWVSAFDPCARARACSGSTAWDKLIFPASRRHLGPSSLSYSLAFSPPVWLDSDSAETLLYARASRWRWRWDCVYIQGERERGFWKS